MTRGPDDRKDEENMNFVGIDIGSTASKVSVRGDKEINYVLPTGWSSKETAGTIKEKLLEEGVDVEAEDTKVVATGYGRIAVDYADYVITEITCHARGGREFAGNDCAVIDVGGQDTKVIILEDGMVKDFLMNDKCSAGTGKFLEIMANRLGVTLQELGGRRGRDHGHLRRPEPEYRHPEPADHRRNVCGRSGGFCGRKSSPACPEKGSSREDHPDRRLK